MPDEPIPEDVPVDGPEDQPVIEEVPAQRYDYAVEYDGHPDPETLEGRVWYTGRYHWLPEAIAHRLCAQDSRFRILSWPAPRPSSTHPEAVRSP